MDKDIKVEYYDVDAPRQKCPGCRWKVHPCVKILDSGLPSKNPTARLCFNPACGWFVNLAVVTSWKKLI